MTPDVQAAAERVAAFLDAWEDPAQGRGAISTLRSEGLRLTALDLRRVLAAIDPAGQPIAHVPTQAGLDYLAVRQRQNPHGAKQ